MLDKAGHGLIFSDIANSDTVSYFNYAGTNNFALITFFQNKIWSPYGGGVMELDI
jgi:hypothetical protein